MARPTGIYNSEGDEILVGDRVYLVQEEKEGKVVFNLDIVTYAVRTDALEEIPISPDTHDAKYIEPVEKP